MDLSETLALPVLQSLYFMKILVTLSVGKRGRIHGEILQVIRDISRISKCHGASL
jgi:hypothetical protein